jgi:hypothetical protein
MAVFSNEELRRLRQDLAQRIPEGATWTKAEVHDALQAVEDKFEQNGRSQLAQAIEQAAPGVFSATAKKYVVAAWMILTIEKELG